MVTEDVPNVVNPEYKEHSLAAKSKRVIDGPFIPAKNGAGQSIEAVQGAVGGVTASITLEQGKAYRIMSDTNLYYKLGKGATTAVAAVDIFMAANVPQIILMDGWNTLAFIQQSGAGIIQAVEIAS